MTAILTLVDERLSMPVEFFSIEESAGQHDLITVRFKQRPVEPLKSGAAVRLQQTSALEPLDAYAYIDTALPFNGGDGTQGGVYFMLAASTVMRSGKATTWNNRAPFEIASNIVARHGFGLEMDKAEGRLGHFAQSTESDWEALRKLATEIGFVLTATNTVVRLLDPNLTIRRGENQALIPLEITHGTQFVMEESLVPVGYESYEFTGVDKFGVSFSVKVNEDSPVVKTIREEVDSLGDALAAKDRVLRRSAAQNRATLVTDYHPSIHSGNAVLVNEGDRERHWFVLNAIHNYNADNEKKSSTVLSLCRHAHRFTGGSRPATMQRPGTVLSAGRWRTTHSWAREL